MKKYITSLCCFIAFISMGMTANNPSDDIQVEDKLEVVNI